MFFQHVFTIQFCQPQYSKWCFFPLVRDWAKKFVQSVGFGETKSFLLQPCGCMAIFWLERNHPGFKFTPFTIIRPKIVVNGNPKAPRTFNHFYVCLPSFLYKTIPWTNSRETLSLGVETLIVHLNMYIYIYMKFFPPGSAGSQVSTVGNPRCFSQRSWLIG